MSGVHDGRRARLRERYLSQGLEGFADHEVVELLLTYAIPRRDVNDLAHRLLQHFGGLPALLEATGAELMEVSGMGERTATLIRLMLDVNRRYLIQRERAEEPARLGSAGAAGRLFAPYFYGVRVEQVYAAFVDDDLRLISCRLLFEGSVNQAAVNLRKLVETALRDRATGVILAHNHPAGQALPSVEDRETTLAIRSALNTVQIRLLDHIIVSGGEYCSMAEGGFLKPEAKSLSYV